MWIADGWKDYEVIDCSKAVSYTHLFHIPPLYTTILLVLLAAVIVLRKNATVKVLDIMVPIMAGCYFFITLFIIFKNIGQLPAVFHHIFSEAFGLRQVAAGGFGADVYKRQFLHPSKNAPTFSVSSLHSFSSVSRYKTPAAVRW